MTLHDHIYSNFNISISFKPSITFAGSTGNLGSVRGRSLKAGRVRRMWRQQCLVLLSSIFFLSLHRRMQCACVLFLLNSSTFFCQPHYLMFLQSAWTNFDETWSQWPMTKRADVQWPLTRSKVIQGQRGQKSIFSPKCIKSTRFHGMFTILIHMIAYDALYKSYLIKNSSGVIWGHRGQKIIRIQKIFKKIISARCNIARWCHLLRWKIINQCCLSWHRHGFKGHLGSFPVPAKIGWNGQNQLYLGIWRNDQAHHS